MERMLSRNPLLLLLSTKNELPSINQQMPTTKYQLLTIRCQLLITKLSNINYIVCFHRPSVTYRALSYNSSDYETKTAKLLTERELNQRCNSTFVTNGWC